MLYMNMEFFFFFSHSQIVSLSLLQGESSNPSLRTEAIKQQSSRLGVLTDAGYLGLL